MNDFESKIDVLSPNQLAELLEIELKKLTFIIYKLTPSQKYISFKIPKKNNRP